MIEELKTEFAKLMTVEDAQHELTEAQLGQFWAYLHHALLAAQNNWLAYQNGWASEVSWHHARDQAVAHLGSRAAQIYWKYDKFEYHTGFVEQIDAQLAQSEPMQIETAMRQMLEEIRSLGADEL